MVSCALWGVYVGVLGLILIDCVENLFKLFESEYDYLNTFQDKRIVQFAARTQDDAETFLIFQSENETVPYDYIKQVKTKEN